MLNINILKEIQGMFKVKDKIFLSSTEKNGVSKSKDMVMVIGY